MSHPRYKGRRDPVLLRLQPQDKQLLKDRAQAAGLDYTEYVLALMRRDEVDEDGRPLWMPGNKRGEALPLAI